MDADGFSYGHPRTSLAGAMVLTRSRRSRALLPLFLASLVVALAAPVAAQSKKDVDEKQAELEEAVGERSFVGAELDAAIARYQDVNNQLAELSYRVAQMRDRVTEFESDVRELRAQVRQRAVDAYISGGTNTLDLFFAADTYAEVVTSQQVLEHAASKDITLIDQLAATRRQMERLRGELETDQTEVEVLREEADDIVHQLDSLYEQYDEQVKVADAAFREAKRKYEEEKRRQQLAALARKQGAAAGVPAGVTPGFICPVTGAVGFINDWGFPRSGGRTHKGTDMFAPRGRSLVAVGNGSIRLRTSRLGGTTIWLSADHGTSYYYAHLDGYAPGMATGVRVKAGQVIGYVGDSGNARGGSPHLHFQVHPGGGRPVNPYPTLVRACR